MAGPPIAAERTWLGGEGRFVHGRSYPTCWMFTVRFRGRCWHFVSYPLHD